MSQMDQIKPTKGANYERLNYFGFTVSHRLRVQSVRSLTSWVAMAGIGMPHLARHLSCATDEAKAETPNGVSRSCSSRGITSNQSPPPSISENNFSTGRTSERYLDKVNPLRQDLACAIILSSPQCSNGINQSRPFPARSVKIMESAGHHCKDATRHGDNWRVEDQEPENPGCRNNSSAGQKCPPKITGKRQACFRKNGEPQAVGSRQDSGSARNAMTRKASGVCAGPDALTNHPGVASRLDLQPIGMQQGWNAGGYNFVAVPVLANSRAVCAPVQQSGESRESTMAGFLVQPHRTLAAATETIRCCMAGTEAPATDNAVNVKSNGYVAATI